MWNKLANPLGSPLMAGNEVNKAASSSLFSPGIWLKKGALEVISYKFSVEFRWPAKLGAGIPNAEIWATWPLNGHLERYCNAIIHRYKLYFPLWDHEYNISLSDVVRGVGWSMQLVPYLNYCIFVNTIQDTFVVWAPLWTRSLSLSIQLVIVLYTMVHKDI